MVTFHVVDFQLTNELRFSPMLRSYLLTVSHAFLSLEVNKTKKKTKKTLPEDFPSVENLPIQNVDAGDSFYKW